MRKKNSMKKFALEQMMSAKKEVEDTHKWEMEQVQR
jgi:hypothetical protein